MQPKRALIMHPRDNVATAVAAIQPGDEVAAMIGPEIRTVVAVEEIPFGFKVALVEIPSGEIIRKYGEVIGTANSPIAPGALVHIHNLDGTRARGDLAGRSSE